MLMTLVLLGLAVASAKDFKKVFTQGPNAQYLRNSSQLFDVQDYLPLDAIATDARWIHLKEAMVGGKDATIPAGVVCEVFRGSFVIS